MSFQYRSRDKPWYPLGKSLQSQNSYSSSPSGPTGHGLVLMYIALGIIFTLIYFFALRRENWRRDQGERNEIIGDDTGKGNELNGRFRTVADTKREKGDGWSGYRYRL